MTTLFVSSGAGVIVIAGAVAAVAAVQATSYSFDEISFESLGVEDMQDTIDR